MQSTRTISVLGATALMFSISAFAQSAKVPDPKLVECRASNVKLDREIDAMFAQAKAGGKITGAESIRFKQLEQNIVTRRAVLAKDGFTLADCQTMTKEYEAEKTEVQKMMAGPAVPSPKPAPTTPPAKQLDPKVTECRAANVKLDKEIDAMYAQAKASGKITGAEAVRFKQLEQNIVTRRAALAKDGFTLADCQTMTKEYEAEKAEVQKMMAGPAISPKPTTPPAKPLDPKVAECRAANAKLDSEIDALFAKAKASGKITPVEAARFKTMEANIATRRAALSKDGFTLADCQKMTKEYEAEKAEVMKFAK